MRKIKIIYKALTILLVSSIILVTLVLVPDSFSWFIRSFENSATEVVAATTKDIIDEFAIYYDGDQPIIRLKRAKGLEYPPVIFFSVEGNIGDYVLNINPIKLEEDKVYEILILPNVNLPQSISLAYNLFGVTEGQIRIKHLNEFIDEPVHISMPNMYLIKRYFANIGLNPSIMEAGRVQENNDLIEHIIKMIIYTSGYVKWEEAKWEEYSDISVDSCSYYMPISKVEISPQQSSVVDKIAPSLLEYNERLYSLLENLINELNSLSCEKQKLELENKSILEENEKNIEGTTTNPSTTPDPILENPTPETPIPADSTSKDENETNGNTETSIEVEKQP